MRIHYEKGVPILVWLIVGMVPRASAQLFTRGDLQHQIELYESALSKAQETNSQYAQIGRIELRLAALYQDIGLYDKSEDTFERAIRTFRKPGSPLDLAAAIDGLGTVYLQIGNIAEAERAELKALKIREEVGQKPDLACSWSHLAALYLRERRAAQAREYAERAVTEFSSDANASADEKINAQLTLSLALGLSHKYPEAIERLQSTIRLERETYGPNDFPVGFGTFLLGYVHWKAGELAPAGELMRQGTDIMGQQLGWWSPTYRSVMTQYAHFLRATHQKDRAQKIEQNVDRALAASNTIPNSRHNRETTDATAFF